ncbi:MAG: hypothetical protein KDI28_10655 [Pseudomonadales bacterium]|nr:hypothetical protein [Pseudomonadales bacterium]MCP5357832.1 hypothetical protein [Pseudomonadales bacterium]
MIRFARYLTLLPCLLTSALVQAGSIEFSSALYSTSEITTPATITLTRTGTTTGAASVTVTSTGGTAAAGSDYTAVSTTVSWAAGDAASKTVSVAILDDRAVEETETVILSLSAVSGDTIGTQSSTTLNIVDYEQGTLQFSAATYSVAENGGAAALTVNRTNGSNGTVTINYATANGTATSPAFFTAATGTLSFAEGETSKTIPITIIDNSVGQANKSFTVTLSTITGGAVLGTISSATVTIINDDSDFTPGLTKITPNATGITQSDMITLSQASPFNSANSILATINRIPELAIPSLEATQEAANGRVSIVVGDAIYHLYPYTASQASSTTAAIYLNQDQSGRMVTDEGLQINFQPALANFSVLQNALTLMKLTEMKVTKYGNIEIQKNQGPPPLELDDTGKLVINNSYYDRYNLRPSVVSTLAPGGAKQGVFLVPHPNPALSGEVFMQVIYPAGSTLRQQLFTTAPSVGQEFINALLALNGVNTVRFDGYGIISFKFNTRALRMYADFVIRRVDPKTYSTPSPQTGLFGVGDLNGDGTEDFRMVYSTGDEQYFYLLP